MFYRNHVLVSSFKKYFQLSASRHLKYIPFRAKRNKPRKINPPPPVYNIDIINNSDYLIKKNVSESNNDATFLSPVHAVRTLQAFLPVEIENQIENQKSIIQIHLSLKVRADLKRESVRGVCTFKHGIGSDTKLAVFCDDDDAGEMISLGADFAGVDNLVARISKGWLGFDKAIATANAMPKLLKIARILGPKKLMPSPKSGTVVTNLAEAVKSIKSGASVEFRAEGDSEIKVTIGTDSFSMENLLDNMKCIVTEVLNAQPKGRKSGIDEHRNLNEFVWPPRHFTARRLYALKERNALPAISELELENEDEVNRDNKDFFISEAHIWADRTPLIYINPNLMHPNSVGYYR